MMQNKYKQMVCVLLILLTLGFIFQNSAKQIPASQKDSNHVADVVAGLIEEEQTETSPATLREIRNQVRKAAHAIEFFVLGVELTVWLAVLRVRKPTVQTVWTAFSIGLLCALVDETIQIFSSRGPRIQDVWIDSAGLCVGILLVLLCTAVFRKLHQKNKQKTTAK